jgi:four helix bundle protein
VFVEGERKLRQRRKDEIAKGSRGAEARRSRGAGGFVEYRVDDDFGIVSDPGREGIVRHDQLKAYEVAFRTASEIFQLTKEFPLEERFSLTDQIRRSSRAVCANIAEAWRKRRYRAAFQNSLNHAEAEAAETQTWIRFAEDCGYLEKSRADSLISTYDQITGMLVRMITKPDPWLMPPLRKG